MINTAAMMILKAVWGQGHGRERSYGMGDRSSAFDRVLGLWVCQLGNCPWEYAAVNVKTLDQLGTVER